MLRNFENIWSKRLVNSEKVAIFDVPNHHSLGLSYIDFSEIRSIARFFRCIQMTIQAYGGLATNRKGFASSFIKNIINQIFGHMPNHSENLKPGDNSTLTSTQPSEKGKSQLQKLLQSALKKADEKEAENKRLKAELYHKMFYLARNNHFTFSLFEKSNPVDKCDWEKLYKAEMKLREAEE